MDRTLMELLFAAVFLSLPLLTLGGILLVLGKGLVTRASGGAASGTRHLEGPPTGTEQAHNLT